jgi:hypothetical protein
MTANPVITHGLHKAYDYLNMRRPHQPVFIEQLNRHFIDQVNFYTWQSEMWESDMREEDEHRVAYFRVYPKTN